MTEGPPEDELAEETVHSDGADPEEYDASGEETVSGATGTVYEAAGEHEPEATPQDTDREPDELE